MIVNPWFVWNPAGPRQPSYFHETCEKAKDEAERLARIHPNQKFHVCKVIGTMIKRDVDWISAGDADDEIPF